MVLNASENVQVAVRVRPLTGKERERGDEELVACVGDKTLQVLDPEQQRGRTQTATAYQFNRTFGTECTQDELFQGCGVLNLLDHVLEGYSATVFAYGSTGSGKTYTITGRPESVIKHGSGDVTDGLVIRCVETLFNKVRALQRDGLQFKVRASCVEIYNETVLDLLKSRSGAGSDALKVKFDTGRGAFFVSDLSYGKCPSEEELLRLYMRALRNRSVAGHELNRDSSRSHAILTVYVDSMVQEEGGRIATRHGKMSFVDLAGSERLKDSKSEGSTRRETGSINRSIFTLGKVISTLCDRRGGQGKAPFRDSKLTQLLMDSIGGTSLTLMLACVSPSPRQLSEALRTLDYASRAKNIRNRPVVLLDPQQQMVAGLKHEIEALRAENTALRQALQHAPALHASASLPSPASSLPRGTGTASSAPQRRPPRPSPLPPQSLSARASLPADTRGDHHQHRKEHRIHHKKEEEDEEDSGDSVLSASSPQAVSGRAQHDWHRTSMAAGRARHGMARAPGGGFGSQRAEGWGQEPGGPLVGGRAGEGVEGAGRLPAVAPKKSREELAAAERALMDELGAAARFSYFDQASPAAYRQAPSSRPPAHLNAASSRIRAGQDGWEERWRAGQEMESAEARLRQEVAQYSNHTKQTQQPRPLPAAGSSVSPGKRSKGSGRGGLEQGFRELDRLSKYSYFTDEAVRRHPPAGDSSPPRHPPPRPLLVSNALPDKHPAPAAAPAVNTHASAQRRATQHSTASSEVRQRGREEGGVRWERESKGGARPSSADRERMLEQALQHVMPPAAKSTVNSTVTADNSYAATATPHGGEAGVFTPREAVGDVECAEEDWMRQLNPLAGLNLDALSGEELQLQLSGVLQSATAGRRPTLKPAEQTANLITSGFALAAGDAQLPSQSRWQGSEAEGVGKMSHANLKQGAPGPSSSLAASEASPAVLVPRDSMALAQDRAERTKAGGVPAGVDVNGQDARAGQSKQRAPAVHVGPGPSMAALSGKAAGSGPVSSYEALMANLEQSRVKAELARRAIVQRKAEWEQRA